MTISGTINGNSIAGYVRSLKRMGNLCAPPQTATILLSPNFPHAVTVSDQVIIYENGTRTFTGYVTRVSLTRPEYGLTVACDDTYTRATSFFIEDSITTGHDANDQPIPNYTPQMTAYWIGYLCGLCGLDYTVDGFQYPVPAGVQIGLRTVAESLLDIIAYSTQYVYVNPNGVAEFKRIAKGSPSVTFTDFIDFEWKKDDEWTRNVVKVYGYSGDGLRPNSRIFVSKSVSIPEIVPDRVTAVATPLIQTYGEAERVADYLLDELGAVTEVASGTIVGDPTVRIGQVARMVHDGVDLTGIITSLEVTWDENGYVMVVTIGERCPRISGWSYAAPPVYAGTTGHGVYKSTDGGQTWFEYNSGLPATARRVSRLGFNGYGEGMSIVNGRLYYTDGENGWTLKTLPAPVNTAGDDPAPTSPGLLVAVDALGGVGQFAVLTTSALGETSGSIPTEARSWVYLSENISSGSGSWTSTQLEIDALFSSGSPYNVAGDDLSSKFGFPYVIGSSSIMYSNMSPNRYNVCIEKRWTRTCRDWLNYENFAPECESNPSLQWILNWYVADTPFGDAELVVELSGGTYKDNLFLYGMYNWAGPASCPRDEDGYYRWPFQEYGILYKADWRTGITYWRFPGIGVYSLPVTPENENNLFEVNFNIFYSPYRTLNASSFTYGDVCGTVHRVGTSPYGDIWGKFGYSGPVDPNTPYPIVSNFGTGRFFSVVT